MDAGLRWGFDTDLRLHREQFGEAQARRAAIVSLNTHAPLNRPATLSIDEIVENCGLTREQVQVVREFAVAECGSGANAGGSRNR